MSEKNSSRKQSSRLSTPVRLGVAAVAACFIGTPALSNPLNPTVVNGAASFNQAGSVLTVTNSPGAIINWQKFSIQAGETTYFAQASASSTVLNRVLSDPTAIYGTLGSNGRVWLVNPAGIMVGPGGRVDVAGFVASTLNISNADFLAGRNVFINDGSAKNVINQGEIRTPAGGSVYLIGSNVANEGIIVTPQGETILAAGATVSLIDSATPGVKVDITGAEGNATNLGSITAEAGRIGIAGVIVRNSGLLNASSVVSEGGRIFLKASQDAYVDGNGRIVTTGTKGGSVEVLGNRVAIMDNAEIDASGTSGGGRIMIGGDYQGKNPDIQNANITWFGPDATLKADATEVGDGGTVIVWADDTTRAYGSISARGGAAGGNGGFVETSGKRYLDTPGIRVDVGASNGAGGLWLLDPSDINIVATGTSDTTYAGGIFSYGGTIGTLVDDDINAALAGGSVTISTSSGYGGSGNIAFDAAGGPIIISNGTGAARTLTLAADNDVIFYGGTTTFQTTASGSLGIDFNPGAGRKVDVLSSASAIFYGGGGGLVGAYISGASGKTWENSGTVTLSGVSYIDLNNGVSSTFNNNSGGILNLGSTQGWAIQSTSGSQAEPINNAGTINVTETTAIEALYSQSSTGALTIGTGKLLSMQNAGTIYGGVAIGADARLVISEVHSGARTFYNANISGPGMLDLAQPTTFIGSTMSNGVLGQSNGAFSVPGSGLTFSGNMTFVSNSDVGFGSGIYNFNNLTVLAGWDGSGFTSTDIIPGTGDIVIAGSTITSAGAVNLWAGNNIAVSSSGSTGTWIQGAAIDVHAGNNLTITGGYSTAGSVLIGSLSNSATTVSIVAGNSVIIDGGEGGVGIGAVGPALAAGEVYIASGASLTSAGADVTIHAQKNVTINGTVISAGGCGDCGDGVWITAGYSPTVFDNSFGGNIKLGSQSVIVGYSVGLRASSGYVAAGNIVQDPGGVIAINGNYSGYSNFFKADGNLLLDGVVVAGNLAGGGVYGYAGYYGAPGKTLRIANIASPGGGNFYFQSTGDAVIGSITAPTGYVGINADGAIYDSNGSALNITADTISLSSQFGGVAGGLAISMDTLAVSSLTGYVGYSATSGGISIRNLGAQPASVSITDSAISQSAINFYNSGDLTLNGASSFATPNGGSILVSSGGSLSYYGASIDTAGGSLILGAGSILNFDTLGGFSIDGSLGIAAPVVYVHGGGYESGISATGDIFLGATQQLTIGNFDFTGITGSNITVNTGILTMQTGGLFAAGGNLDITAGNIYATDNSRLQATNNITTRVAGDFRLNHDSHILAGNDVFLTFAGSGSTLYVNDTAGLDPSTIESGIPTTVHLDFLGRSSGGVVIDGVPTTITVAGGSGFYANGLPATEAPGGGLTITYANSVVVDPCAASPDLCKPPSPTDNPVVDVVESDPCATNPDSVECKQSSNEETDSFGGLAEFGTNNEQTSQKTIPTCSI